MASHLAQLLEDREALVEIIWEKKALERGGSVGQVHVDDLILRFADGKHVYVQVKNSPAGRAWTIAKLGSSGVAAQFWRQWSATDVTYRTDTTLRLASRGDLSLLEDIGDAARCSQTPSEFLHGQASNEIVLKARELAFYLGVSVEDTNFLDFLKSIHCEQLYSAEACETRISDRLRRCGDDVAPDLANRLIRLVARSKHPGSARTALTRDSLVKALRDDGLPETTLISAGILRTRTLDDGEAWDGYRARILRELRTLQLYGLDVERHVYADLPALFVPLKLARITSGQLQSRQRQAREVQATTLAERLAQEAERSENPGFGSSGKRYDGGSNVTDLATALGETRRFAIIGGPGSGKTTTLKWLAVAASLSGPDGRHLRSAHGLSQEPLIPVYVRFREFAEQVNDRKRPGIRGRYGFVADFLAEEFKAGATGEVPLNESRAFEMAQFLLESETTLFLFDGLDEVADVAMRRRLFEAVADLMLEYPAPRVILTSRPYAFQHDRAPLELVLFEPLPLDGDARHTFAQQWYRAVRSTLSNKVLQAAEGDDAVSVARAADLARASDSLPELSEIPLLLSILALVHFNRQGLPVDRGTLYDNATLAMLGHWDRDRAKYYHSDDRAPADWALRLNLDEREVRRVVEYLAQWVQLGDGGSEFPRDVAIAGLSEGLASLSKGDKEGEPLRAAALLDQLVDRTGLIQERSPGIFAFIHLSFQEYLTARWYVGLGEAGLEALLRLAGDERQSELLRLTVAILSATRTNEGDQRATSLIHTLAALAPPLAAACLLEAPRVRLGSVVADSLSIATFLSCSNDRGHYFQSDVTARLIWAVLGHSQEPDHVLLEIVSRSIHDFDRDDFRGRMHRGKHHDFEFDRYRHHRMSSSAMFAVMASRPEGRLCPPLCWVLGQLARSADGRETPLARIAKLILIEAGELTPAAHIPDLIRLLPDDDDEFGRANLRSGIGNRAERLLERLWGDDAYKQPALEALAASLVSSADNEGQGHAGEVAWRAIGFLIRRGERRVPGLVRALVQHGLYDRSHHTEVCDVLRNLLADPASRGEITLELQLGAENSDDDIRQGSVRLLHEFSIESSTPSEQASIQHPNATRATEHTEPTSLQETAEALSDDLWSDDPPTAWRAACQAFDTKCAVLGPGLAHALVHGGILVDRPLATDRLRNLYSNPQQELSVRSVLLGGVANNNDKISAACAILLLRVSELGIGQLLKRFVRASIRDADQLSEALDLLISLIRSSRGVLVLGALGTELSEKPESRVAGRLALMLAGEQRFEVSGLSRALVLGGLRQSAEHDRIIAYVKTMSARAETVTLARRALSEGLTSNERNVAWGAARCLCEMGSRTDKKLPSVLARVGLKTPEFRDRARNWLLDLLRGPRTALGAREALEHAMSEATSQYQTQARDPEYAWTSATCLTTAGVIHADNLAQAIVLGALSDRDKFSERLAEVKALRDRSPELAQQIDEALWKALDDKNADVQWGAVRLLLELCLVQLPADRSSEHRPDLSDDTLIGGDDDDDNLDEGSPDEVAIIKRLGHLWRVLINEAPREPLAEKGLGELSSNKRARGPERRALLKLLEDPTGKTAFNAARRLIELGDDHLSSIAAILVRKGLTDVATSGEAARLLDLLLKQNGPAAVARAALEFALWDEDSASSAAAYELARGRPADRAILHALVLGTSRGRHWLEAERQIEAALNDPALRAAAIEALTTCLYSDDYSRYRACALLFRAKPELFDRLILTMDGLSKVQPWIPLALVALTGQQTIIKLEAERLSCTNLAALISAD